MDGDLTLEESVLALDSTKVGLPLQINLKVGVLPHLGFDSNEVHLGNQCIFADYSREKAVEYYQRAKEAIQTGRYQIYFDENLRLKFNIVV
jgi:hypothetical protein